MKITLEDLLKHSLYYKRKPDTKIDKENRIISILAESVAFSELTQSLASQDKIEN
jgi:hypothetical protein